MVSPCPFAGELLCWLRATPAPKPKHSRHASERLLVRLDKMSAPAVRTGGARAASGRNQMGKRFHRGRNRHRDLFVDLIKQRVAYAEEQLERSAFLEGDRPTIADFFLFVATGWLRYQNVSTEQWPHLHRYRAIIAERPAVQKALQEEGLI